jgi:two-component system cell cycle sensor histidine kinase/response regulator CckA
MGVALQWREKGLGGLDSALATAAFEANPEALAILESGRVLYANPAFLNLFGAGVPEEILGCSRMGQPAAETFCARDEGKDPGRSSSGYPLCYFAAVTRDGTLSELEATCAPVTWQDRHALVVCLRDVSQRERRRAVRDSEKRYHTVFNASAIGILHCSLDGKILESNPAAERLLGYSKEELRGLHLASFTQPKDHLSEQTLFQELTGGQRDTYQIDVQYAAKSGLEGWVRSSVSLVRGAGGEPQAVIAMMEDITERMRAEQQLRDAQKMEAVGRLVGGVAHDFNNLLTGVMLYCDLLLAGLDRQSKLGHHAEEIRLAAEQGAALIQQLLALARQQVVEPRLLCVNETVTRTHNLLSRLIGESIAFRTRLDDSLGEVRMDPAQAQQILFNLVLNARDAMPHGGTIAVETANSDFFLPTATVPANSRIPGVRLTVRDNGSGMTDETLAHLFEPFFTTKKAGRGNGLGLATVHDIVRKSGGVIEVESEIGRGTEVRVFLPRVETSAASVPEAAFSERSTDETILLLEDNVTIREAAERILAECGYRVFGAATGPEAITLANSLPGKVDLLLADVDLPGMSGRDVARELGGRWQDLKSLYMSGYQLMEEGDQSSDGSVVFFQKPFTGAVLLQRVREILDAVSPLRSGEKESDL